MICQINRRDSGKALAEKAAAPKLKGKDLEEYKRAKKMEEQEEAERKYNECFGSREK